MTKKKWVRQQLEKLYGNDNCSICGKPFIHNRKNYGGITSAGKFALVGDCCLSKLKGINSMGVYWDKEHAHLASQVMADVLMPGGSKTVN
jgi:hypothetical protein